MRLICKVFGHKWVHGPQITLPKRWYCKHCGVSYR